MERHGRAVVGDLQNHVTGAGRRRADGTWASLSALVAGVAAPFIAWGLARPEVGVIAGIMTTLLICKHHANISRLMAGTEPKIGGKEKA